MIYQVNLIIPANTGQDAPEIERITVPFGRVKRIALLFPSGCAGLAHIQIYHNQFQVWPTTPELSFLGDGHLIVFDENYDLDDSWNVIQVSGWNDDDTFSHTVTVWISVLPQEQAWALFPLTGLPRYVE